MTSPQNGVSMKLVGAHLQVTDKNMSGRPL